MLTNFLDKMPKIAGWVEGQNLSKPKETKFLGRVMRNGGNLLLNLSPWLVTGGCMIAGSYGLGAYITLDLVKGFRDNLKKNKLISDPVISLYDTMGYEILNEEDYNKENSKGKLSDDNSVLALFNSIYKGK